MNLFIYEDKNKNIHNIHTQSYIQFDEVNTGSIVKVKNAFIWSVIFLFVCTNRTGSCLFSFCFPFNRLDNVDSRQTDVQWLKLVYFSKYLIYSDFQILKYFCCYHIYKCSNECRHQHHRFVEDCFKCNRLQNYYCLK